MGSLKKPQLGIPSLATAVHSARTFTGQVTHASSRRSRVDSQLWQIAYPEPVRRFPFEASAAGKLHPNPHHSLPISVLSSPWPCTGPADRTHSRPEQPFGRARRLHSRNWSRNFSFEQSDPFSALTPGRWLALGLAPGASDNRAPDEERQCPGTSCPPAIGHTP